MNCATSSTPGQTASFGIYIKTFKPDHYLAKALIASLDRYAPGCSITIIPEDDFKARRIWGRTAMSGDLGFLRQLRGYYKKLWVFWGPYERFIYLDADMLSLRSIAPLVRRVQMAEPPFFMVCAESKILKKLQESDLAARDCIYESHIGNLELLSQFDGEYDWAAQFPFNSGFFAASRCSVDKSKCEELFRAAKEFQKAHMLPDLCYTRSGLFMGDQGFLNYLLAKMETRLELLADVFVWGGRQPRPGEVVSPNTEACAQLFVHWAGCRRPTPVNQDVPWGDVWLNCYESFYEHASSLSRFGEYFEHWAQRKVSGIRRKLAQGARQ